MKQKIRLTKRLEFERVRRSGKSYAHPLIVLITLPNDLDSPRIGVSAGRSIGGAVQRNRAKRRIRAIVQPLIPKIQIGWDVLFLARKPILQATYEELNLAIHTLLQRAKLIALM